MIFIGFRYPLFPSYCTSPLRIIITFAFVISPMEGLKIAEVIYSAFRHWDGMINFPPIIPSHSIGDFRDPSTTLIFSVQGFIISGDKFTFVPDDINDRLIKNPSPDCGINIPYHSTLLFKKENILYIDNLPQYVVFVKDIIMLAGQEKMEGCLTTLAFQFLMNFFPASKIIIKSYLGSDP